MNQQTAEAFLIVRQTQDLIQAYEERLPAANRPYYEALRRCLGHNPGQYRGISRNPLLPFGYHDAACVVLEDAETGARKRLAELVGYRPHDIRHNLLSSHGAAREVFGLLADPSRWEIIRICRPDQPEGASVLGYDVGYWGGAGDHFSIICDSAVTPTWHPPQPDAFESLVEALRPLNSHFLFSSAETAAGFRTYYRGQYWAETESEMGEFAVIEVGVSHAGA